MKQGLQLKFSQNLSLTPQLQQAIKLLQLSTLELNQEIDALMQTNPLLERVDDGEEEAYEDTAGYTETMEAGAENDVGQPTSVSDLEVGAIPGDEIGMMSSSLANEVTGFDEPQALDASDTEFTDNFTAEFDEEFDVFSNGSRWDENNTPAEDDSDFKQQETLQQSLHDHLMSQLALMPLSERDQMLTMLLVDSINEDGYLEHSLEEIAAEMPEELEIDVMELQTALRHIQHLDPTGVGARSLSECLLLQLDTLPQDVAFLQMAKQVVQHHLSLLGSRDFTKLRKEIGCDEATLKQVHQLITSLNPRPGAAFSYIGSEQYIQHEVIVKKVKGIWMASLNESVIPKLRINQLYAGILKRNRDSSSQYLQSQMQEAKWMIKNIQQRFSTILRVSQAIVDRQRNFLEYGEVAMKPLVLREIADELDLHESTISRVTTNKYMLTPRGIFELKYFFGSSVATESGGTCSATAIRALIKKLVDQENPKKPYSDNQITDLLAKQGIIVARRTIAKYRESLNIPPANLRKTL